MGVHTREEEESPVIAGNNNKSDLYFANVFLSYYRRIPFIAYCSQNETHGRVWGMNRRRINSKDVWQMKNVHPSLFQGIFPVSFLSSALEGCQYQTVNEMGMGPWRRGGCGYIYSALKSYM